MHLVDLFQIGIQIILKDRVFKLNIEKDIKPYCNRF